MIHSINISGENYPIKLNIAVIRRAGRVLGSKSMAETLERFSSLEEISDEGLNNDQEDLIGALVVEGIKYANRKMGQNINHPEISDVIDAVYMDPKLLEQITDIMEQSMPVADQDQKTSSAKEGN